MSETNETEERPEAEGEPAQPTELEMLKKTAKMMGVSHSNNISVEKLKEKLEAHRRGEKLEEEQRAQASAQEQGPMTRPEPRVAPVAPASREPPRKLTAEEERLKFRKEQYQDARKLVRIRVTCLDPSKKDVPGEIFTVANKYIGTVRRFVPFGETTEDGWHVENCIYKLMQERRFAQRRVVKVAGQEQVRLSDDREFAIEVLPPLTKEQIQKLALKQAAAKGQVEAEEE